MNITEITSQFSMKKKDKSTNKYRGIQASGRQTQQRSSCQTINMNLTFDPSLASKLLKQVLRQQKIMFVFLYVWQCSCCVKMLTTILYHPHNKIPKLPELKLRQSANERFELVRTFSRQHRPIRRLQLRIDQRWQKPNQQIQQVDAQSIRHDVKSLDI